MTSEGGGIPIRKLKSVVGSPFYVAPEVSSLWPPGDGRGRLLIL